MRDNHAPPSASPTTDRHRHAPCREPIADAARCATLLGRHHRDRKALVRAGAASSLPLGVRLLASRPATRTRSTSTGARAPTSGTSTATSTSTSTAVSACSVSATPTPRSSRPSSRPRAPAPTSPRPPRSRCAWPRSSAGASTSTRCASPTRAPSRPWTPSGSPGRRPAATTSSRSRARYHGHHDTVMFSVLPNSDTIGGREQPPTTPMSLGIPADVANHTAVVPFNDAAAFEAHVAEHGDEIACLILEPVMMNIGIIEPEPGYLQALRDICDRERRRADLRRGEVRAPPSHAGGAIEPLRRAARPGLLRQGALRRHARRRPSAAKPAVMDIIEHGAAQQGTFNGNPLVAAAGLACLTEVLTPDAYAHLADARAPAWPRAARPPSTSTGIPAHTVDLGCQGLRVVPPGAARATTATSSRPSPSCSRRRSRGRSTGASS